MQILKKKIILKTTNNNYLNSYKYYLKNLNFLNKLKKKKNILLNDIILLKLKNFYLINFNLNKIFYLDNSIENLNLNYKKKENLLYTIRSYSNQKEKILMNINNLNYFILNLYTYLLFKKFKKYEIKKFLVIKKNKKKYIYYKTINFFFPYLKGRIIKSIKKKYILISFFSLIKKMHSFFLYKKNKNIFLNNPYLRKRYQKKIKFKNLFKIYIGKKKKFKINDIQKNNIKNLKLNFSRKNYVSDFKQDYLLQKLKKKNKIKFLYKYYYLDNLKKKSKILFKK